MLLDFKDVFFSKVREREVKSHFDVLRTFGNNTKTVSYQLPTALMLKFSFYL